MRFNSLNNWLSRLAPDKALQECFELPVVLQSDVGLVRKENQDRVAAVRIRSIGGRRGLIAIAVSDGMGGMRDGGKCASIALSSFFGSLATSSERYIAALAQGAIVDANRTVFDFAGSKGGATLSALVIDDHGDACTVHVGDSRIYAIDSHKAVTRLTRDDSLAEIAGGQARGLLQFVGMGEEMIPHVELLPPSVRQLAILTDGIHFIDFQVLASVLVNCVTSKSMGERLAALARWCGGPDNASSAIIDLQALGKKNFQSTVDVQLWDQFGNLALLGSAALLLDERSSLTKPDSVDQLDLAGKRRAKNAIEPLKKAKTESKKDKNKSKRMKDRTFQLEIHIDGSSPKEGGDDSSR